MAHLGQQTNCVLDRMRRIPVVMERREMMLAYERRSTQAATKHGGGRRPRLASRDATPLHAREHVRRHQLMLGAFTLAQPVFATPPNA
mmetsp:Transcript_3179/g.11495  ORF Transcript_3179/g.11495 Transcript_3179/m.11495 type:complete len:88 (+) Transcript_3179:268-531(+)